MKLIAFAAAAIALLGNPLPAQEAGGRQIENSVGAVKEAQPGDYIVSPAGKKYVLTAEEIAIAKGEFDYGDLSKVAATPMEDGSEIKTLSTSHRVRIYPDGQAIHEIKTVRSFTAYIRDAIEKNYYLAKYIDRFGNALESGPSDAYDFTEFRANVSFQQEEWITVNAFNYRGESFKKCYCSKPDFIWGKVRPNSGSYSFLGAPHKIEDFDKE